MASQSRGKSLALRRNLSAVHAADGLTTARARVQVAQERLGTDPDGSVAARARHRTAVHSVFLHVGRHCAVFLTPFRESHDYCPIPSSMSKNSVLTVYVT